MKILSSRKHHYLTIVSIFLLMAALIVGMVGCGQAAASSYTLTIASTTGGSVTPGVGPHTYNAGTTVNLVATPASGYLFVNWAGDVSTIANVNAANTTITMNGDYEITARFASVVGSKTETVTNGTVDARDEADTEVLVSGNATVAVAQFADNPGGGSPTGFNSLGKYIDVHIPDVGQIGRAHDCTTVRLESRMTYSA